MKKLKKGFTLVELLVVIVIISILGTLTAVSYTKFIDKAYEVNLNAELNQLKTLYTGYLLDPSSNISAGENGIKDELDNFVNYCYENGLDEGSLNYCVNENFVEEEPAVKGLRRANEKVDNTKRFAFLLLKFGDSEASFYGALKIDYQNNKLTTPKKWEGVVEDSLEEITEKTVKQYDEFVSDETWEYAYTEDKKFQKPKEITVTLHRSFGSYDDAGEFLDIKVKTGKKLDKVLADLYANDANYYVSNTPKKNYFQGTDGLYYFKADTSKWIDSNGKDYDFSKPIPIDSQGFFIDFVPGEPTEDSSFDKLCSVYHVENYQYKVFQGGGYQTRIGYKIHNYYYEDLDLALMMSKGHYVDSFGIENTEEVCLYKSYEATNFHLPENKILTLAVNDIDANGVQHSYEASNNNKLIMYSAVDKQIDKTVLNDALPKVNLTLHGTTNIDGELCIGAKAMALNCTVWGDNPNELTPVGSLLQSEDYNAITLAGSDVINIKEEGKLTIYGKVNGNGTINNYGYLAEMGEIKDLRGGTNIRRSMENGVSPFRYYQINHIESKVVNYENSKYDICLFPKSGEGDAVPMKMNLITNGIEDGIFVIEDGTVTKYNQNNKLVLDLKGKIHDNYSDMAVACMFPVQNFELNVLSGSVVDITHSRFKIMPTGVLNINKGATVNLKSQMVVFEEMTYYSKHIQGTNARCTAFYQREELDAEGKAKQEPGKLIIAGTLNITGNASGIAGKPIITETGVFNYNAGIGQISVVEGEMNRNGLFDQKVYNQTVIFEIDESETDLSKYVNAEYLKGKYLVGNHGYVFINANELNFQVVNNEYRPDVETIETINIYDPNAQGNQFFMEIRVRVHAKTI